MTTTVSASAASAGLAPSQYVEVRMAAPPAATGMAGMLMSRLAKAWVSSVRPIAMAAPTYSRNVALTVSRVRNTRPPRPAPTPMATGRLRPVRDGFSVVPGSGAEACVCVCACVASGGAVGSVSN